MITTGSLTDQRAALAEFTLKAVVTGVALGIVFGAALLVVASLTVPFLLEVLRFAVPSGPLLATSLLIGLVSGGWYGVLKLLFPSQNASKSLTSDYAP